MIAVMLFTLFALVALVSALTLVDCFLRARGAYASLMRQRDLARAGFVPQVDAQYVRLRPTASRLTGRTTRPYARRLPRPVPALDAA